MQAAKTIKQAIISDVFPNAFEVRSKMKNEGILCGYNLENVFVEPVLLLTPQMAKWFRRLEYNRILKSISGLTEPNASTEQLSRAIGILRSYQGYYDFSEKISAYSRRLETMKLNERKFDSLVEKGRNTKSIKKLDAVLEGLNVLSTFMDVEKERLEIIEKKRALLAKRKRIRLIIIVFLIIIFILWFMSGGRWLFMLHVAPAVSANTSVVETIFGP